MMTIIFCMMIILSFFIDTGLPLFIYLIAGAMSLNEIAIFVMGYIDGKQDKEDHKDKRVR